MVIYKFGGASVKDAASVKNAANIIRNCREQLIVVVSAMGKTTNNLEQIITAYVNKSGEAPQLLEQLRNNHLKIAEELFPGNQTGVFDSIDQLIAELYWCIEDLQIRDYDFVYDQIAVFGELLSSTILSSYLEYSGFKHVLVDARGLIRTDETYREAQVDWVQTEKCIQRQVLNLQERSMLIQGFIGGTSDNYSTTLGREGSDYTAAILAYCTNASEVVIWKDVAGVFNADPKLFPEANLIPELSYYDAIELAYYGATIIHPKTIKPLQNKKIPLRVKSFLDQDASGTLISENYLPAAIPTYIVKRNQILLSLSPLDFSFIAEDHLRDIFEAFYQFRVKVNMMQNSALNFTVCMSVELAAFEQLKVLLEKHFRLRYNTNCALMTIRHYTDELFHRFAVGKELLLEQRSRNTVQFVYQLS
jgi:aspartate kinase